MTSLGAAGEMKITSDVIDSYPDGILSVVADSYDIYRFVEEVCTTFKPRILARDGKFVVRPDSVTLQDPTPPELVVTLLERLWRGFEGTTNSKGFRVLDPHVGMLWGDGLDPEGIEAILNAVIANGFSAENLVFGMGGGLLQKVNRDTQRFAFKASAIKRHGEWVGVQKRPLDSSKRSQKGRLALVGRGDGLMTVQESAAADRGGDLLQTVFENGERKNLTTFDEVRARAI
jgi:nicotinamide phosphoribosyltransferase